LISYKFAAHIGYYLVEESISPSLIVRYLDAVRYLKPVLSEKDLRWIVISETHPFLIPFIDGALALNKNGAKSGYRHLLLIMSAIIEATPEYADKFLPRQYSISEWLVLIKAGFRGVFCGLIGKIIIRIV